MNSAAIRKHFAENNLNPLTMEEMLLHLPDDQQEILINGNNQPSTQCVADVQAQAEREALPADLFAVCLRHGVSYVSAWRIFAERMNKIYNA